MTPFYFGSTRADLRFRNVCEATLKGMGNIGQYRNNKTQNNLNCGRSTLSMCVQRSNIPTIEYNPYMIRMMWHEWHEDLLSPATSYFVQKFIQADKRQIFHFTASLEWLFAYSVIWKQYRQFYTAQLTAQVFVIPVTLSVWWVFQSPTNSQYSFHWQHLFVLHMPRW